MSARRLVILSVVVLLLFAFILLVERKVPSTEERQRQGELLWDLPEDRIEEIHLEHSGTQVRLKKSGDSWSIVQPETYPADSAAVSEVTSQLADLKRAEGEAAEARPEDYGLASPQAKATIFWTDEKAGSPRQQKTVEFGLEIPGTDVTAARLAGSVAIVFVPSSVAAAARKGLNDLKSREVIGGNALDVSRIEIGRGSGRLSLAKKGSAWWLEQPLADLASSETADELAGELTSLRVQEFVTGPERGNLAALGLDPPLYRVSVASAKGKPVVVELGSTRAQGNSVYGRRENQIFTVESSISEDLSREAVAFRSPQLVRFDRADVTAVTGAFGAQKYALTQKDGGWTLGGKPVLASAADDVLTALLDLRSRGFLEGAAARPPEGSTPAGEIVLTLTNGERWGIRLFSRTGTVAALVGRRPGAFELAQDTVSRLEEAFRKAARAPAPTPVPAARPTEVKKP